MLYIYIYIYVCVCVCVCMYISFYSYMKLRVVSFYLVFIIILSIVENIVRLYLSYIYIYIYIYLPQFEFATYFLWYRSTRWQDFLFLIDSMAGISPGLGDLFASHNSRELLLLFIKCFSDHPNSWFFIEVWVFSDLQRSSKYSSRF